jgi:anti-anti-sigma factor
VTVPLIERAPLPPPGGEHGGVTVVSLRGELDLNDAPALRAFLGGIRWQGPPRSVIDLAGLAFMDCECLGVLIQHRRDIRAQGGTVDLAGPQGSVHRILSLTGGLTMFEVHGTVEQATAGKHGCRYLVFPPPADPPSPRVPKRIRRRPPNKKRGNKMSILKKIRHKARTARGKTKKNTGRITGSRRLKAEGRTGQVTGEAGQATDKIKDAFKH